MNAEITFFEKSVTYDKFVTDIAARLASFMKEDKDDPEYISQRRAERIYGQANVLRWRRSGAIKPIIRPGKIEYPTFKYGREHRYRRSLTLWIKSCLPVNRLLLGLVDGSFQSISNKLYEVIASGVV